MLAKYQRLLALALLLRANPRGISATSRKFLSLSER